MKKLFCQTSRGLPPRGKCALPGASKIQSQRLFIPGVLLCVFRRWRCYVNQEPGIRTYGLIHSAAKGLQALHKRAIIMA